MNFVAAIVDLSDPNALEAARRAIRTDYGSVADILPTEPQKSGGFYTLIDPRIPGATIFSGFHPDVQSVVSILLPLADLGRVQVGIFGPAQADSIRAALDEEASTEILRWGNP